METKKTLSEFTDEELLQEAKKKKRDSTFHALGVGFIVGVAVYSLVVNGFKLITFVLIAFVAFIISRKSDYKAIQDEVKRRQLP